LHKTGRKFELKKKQTAAAPSRREKIPRIRVFNRGGEEDKKARAQFQRRDVGRSTHKGNNSTFYGIKGEVLRHKGGIATR